jgi:CheY-like chemotaxis protein
MENKLIYIADDEIFIGTVTTRFLSPEFGKENIIYIPSGKELISLLFEQNKFPRFLITDNTMPPGPQGIDIIEELYKKGMINKIEKIALCTTDNEGNLPARLSSYGPNTRFFEKPDYIPSLLNYLKG